MKTILNIKTDTEVKKEAFKISQEIGIPLSTLVNAFLKQFISEKQYTFKAPLTPSKELKKILEQSEKEIKTGSVSPVFSNAKDAINWLRS